MEENSNLNALSNLMIDDESHYPKHRYYPGDFVAIVHPSLLDSRRIESDLTELQIAEYKRYIVCLLCNKACAGTCSKY